MPKKKDGAFARSALGFSIKAQMMLIFGVLMSLLTLSISFVIYKEIDSSSRHQADNIGELLSEQTASAATDMLVTGDRLSLNVLLNQLIQNPYVSEANIYSIDNRRIARATSPNSTASDKRQVYSSPIHYQDVIAGYVHLYLNEELLSQKPRDALTIIFAISFLLLLTGLVFLHFYSSMISDRLRLIERQLNSILPAPMNSPVKFSDELARISAFVESQLTEKPSDTAEPEEVIQKPETAAILSLRSKNLGRLQQLLASSDLQDLLQTHTHIIEHISGFYGGTITYTPEGNGFIRFSSEHCEEFSTNALYCALAIDHLVKSTGAHSIATIHTGLGLSLSDDLPEFPDSQHPALTDSAASQALLLANISEPDGLHMFRNHLNWLPADILDIQVSEPEDSFVQISGLKGEHSKELNNQIAEFQSQIH